MELTSSAEKDFRSQIFAGCFRNTCCKQGGADGAGGSSRQSGSVGSTPPQAEAAPDRCAQLPLGRTWFCAAVCVCVCRRAPLLAARKAKAASDGFATWGDHALACLRIGYLAKRAKLVERVWIAVCREAAGPGEHVVPQKWLRTPPEWWHRTAGDATLASPVTSAGVLHPRAEHTA